VKGEGNFKKLNRNYKSILLGGGSKDPRKGLPLDRRKAEKNVNRLTGERLEPQPAHQREWSERGLHKSQSKGNRKCYSLEEEPTPLAERKQSSERGNNNKRKVRPT